MIPADVPETVDVLHRNYQRGMITLGELAEELAKLDQRYGPQPVTREALEDARARCSCARNTDGSVTTSLCPVHADTDPCLTMAQVTGRRRKGTIRRGVCSACGWQDSSRCPVTGRSASACADPTHVGCVAGHRAAVALDRKIERLL